MVRRNISRKKPPFLRVILWLIITGIIVSFVILLRVYTAIFSPAVSLTDENSTLFYIHSNADYETVIHDLRENGYIQHPDKFDWLAKKKKYPNNIKPGRYRLVNNINNNELINLLRSGKQEPLRLVFNSIRSLNDLAGIISKQLEPDSISFIRTFSDTTIIKKYGFNSETFPAMFIPNTYEFYWNTSPERFVHRMNNEYNVFWLNSRIKKSEQIKLKPLEVSILASIVEQESLHSEENQTIAGVFINRINRGIPLQSDPTVIYAWRDFSIRRVLNKHKAINSLYNTYKYQGLPPGPICIPSITSIDAVLNYEKHNYLYFCAKEDFSGYHNFAGTLSEHYRNARLYQQALNRRRIWN